MSVTLCISTYSLLKWRRTANKSILQTINWIAQTGVSHIEFSGLADKAVQRPIKQATLLQARCAQHGLNVASYCTAAELLLSPARQKAAIRELKQQVDIAAALGAPSMRHDVTRGFEAGYARFKGPKTFAQALKIIVPAIQEVADYAQSLGVKTSLENHGFFMQHPQRICKLIETVNHPNFGLTLDMGNFMCVDAEPVAAVKQCLPYAQMVHVKDFHRKPKKQMPPTGWFATPTKFALRGAIVGHGEIDIPAQLKLLKQARYNGPVSLEFEGMEEPTFAVQTGLDYLKQELGKLKML
ncbi:MAG: sugar phosphate isomerase/epimerase family protein [Phycisphaeraceae bacterium JB051]